MSLRHKTTQKFISGLIIFTMLANAFVLFAQPKTAEAVTNPLGVPVNDFVAQTFLATIAPSTTSNTTLHFKDYAIEIGKQLLKMAAKRLLAQMTQATVNWINSGFHGSPLFISNPESFFKDIAKAQVRSIVDMIGYDTFRFPFGRQTALNVIASYKSQLETNAQYTLSKVMNDPDLVAQYRNDFNYGGWNGFLINTQYPQNNYLGFDMIIRQNLASRLQGTLQAPAEKVQSLLQQGMGFLSPQTCPSNPNYNNGTNEFLKPSFKATTGPANESESDYYARVSAEKANWEKKNTCPGGLVATTPGSVAANQIFNALDAPRLSTALDGAIGNSIAAIFDALINKLLDTGLTALSNTISPQPSEDNWSYDGQTLSGTTSGGTALNIPASVSVTVGEGTTTNISGGTSPYNILITAENKKIANATVSNSGSSGPQITVIGVSKGTATATIFDSSTPAKTANITITVSEVGALRVSPPNIGTSIGNTVVAAIEGGDGNYTIKTNPNEVIAAAIVAGKNLIISGITTGSTFLEVKDSANRVVRVDIEIKDPSVLNVSQQSILIFTGQSKDIKIPFINGKINSNSNVGVANVIIVNDTLQITNTKKGQMNLEILGPNHSAQNPQIAQFYVTIADPFIISKPLSYYDDGYHTATLSGGTLPYRTTNCPVQVLCGPNYYTRIDVNSNTLYVYPSGQKGSTPIEVSDGSGQTLSVPFVVN